jgi:hypothetical protein
MGREISDLQETILRLALEKGGYISAASILEVIWGPGLTPKEPLYKRGHSSLSRSLNRLWQRGLIDIYKKIPGGCTGICGTVMGLTPLGEEWGRYLVEAEGDI